MVFNPDVSSYTVFTNGRHVGKKVVPNHENEALQDNKLKFLADSTDLVNLQSGDFFFKRFRQSFFYCNRFLRMSLTSKVYRCVPLCNQTVYLDPQGTRVGFFCLGRIQTITSNGDRKSEQMLAPTFHWRKLPGSAHYIFMEKKIKTGISGKKWN